VNRTSPLTQSAAGLSWTQAVEDPLSLGHTHMLKVLTFLFPTHLIEQ